MLDTFIETITENNKKLEYHIFIGNEAADTDSVISSFIHVFLH